MTGIHALALTIATVIGVAIVIELAKQAKEYISGKITQPKEEEKQAPEPNSKMDEIKEVQNGNGQKVLFKYIWNP